MLGPALLSTVYLIRRLARVLVEGGISNEFSCQDSQAFSPGLHSGQWQQFSRGLQTPDAATWTVYIELCVLLRPQRETPQELPLQIR